MFSQRFAVNTDVYESNRKMKKTFLEHACPCAGALN